MTQIKIGYFADGPWSHQALEKLILDSAISVEFICARYDKPDPFLKEQADIYGVDYITHPKINSEEFFLDISGYGCDLFVSMSFNQIFRKRLIEHPRLKIINCHAGKLPFYRGRNILNWVLINDEKEFGISVHYVDEGVDTGDILAQRLLPITDEDNYATLLERAYSGCAELLYETIKQLVAGKVARKSQAAIHPLGFYCTGRTDGDERLVWDQSSRDIFNFVRAICCPGPEARTFCKDVEIKINRVELLPNAPEYKGIQGAVLGTCSDGFFVKTADSYLKVVEWSGIDRIKIGDRLK
jgi:methionyl-tRNA formyltransferase